MSIESAAHQTLQLLERRLDRLDFYLGKEQPATDWNDTNGHDAPDNEPIATRLSRLERRFAETCAKNRATADLLKLHAQNPELSNQVARPQREARDRQLQQVLASEDEFGPLHSQLTRLQGQNVPDAKHLASLVALQPRIERAAAVQQKQADEVEQLRRRTATALAKWYEQSVLTGAETWVQAEQQLTRMDRDLRRVEHVRARDGA